MGLVTILVYFFYFLPVEAADLRGCHGIDAANESHCVSSPAGGSCLTDPLCYWGQCVSNSAQCDQTCCDALPTCEPNCQWEKKLGKGSSAAPAEDKNVLQKLQKEARKLNPAHFTAPTDLIGRAIKLLMAFIGSISLVLYIYVGILWMTASGNAEQINKAKNVGLWTTFGLVAMLGSYIIIKFIFTGLGL